MKKTYRFDIELNIKPLAPDHEGLPDSEGRGPNHGDLLLADITTTNRITRLHVWANSRHTLTKLFADPGNPQRTIQLSIIGQPVQRIAQRAADHLRLVAAQ